MEASNGLQATVVLISSSPRMIPRATASVFTGNPKSAGSRIPPRTTKSETLVLWLGNHYFNKPSRGSDVHSILRTTGLCIMVGACP